MSVLPAPTGEECEFLKACFPLLDLTAFTERCRIFGEFLYETNETMNLTRIPPSEFWCKHVCDSLSVLRVVPEMAQERSGFAVCDMGCGAGFPSLVLAAALPELHIMPLDSTGKKVAFVQNAAEKMNLAHVKTVHARANELARKAPWHESFRFVTARAVADAAVLLRETSGFLKRGGELIIYRTMTQAGPEMEILRKGKFAFTATEEFLLPANAGTRMFLRIARK